jgi:hypothetical protein
MTPKCDELGDHSQSLPLPGSSAVCEIGPSRQMSKHTRAKKKHPGEPGANDCDTPRKTVHLALECLEVTRGYDGFLRGKPEPALLVAAYRTNGPALASLIGRLLVRAELKSEVPCSIPLEQLEIRYDARFALTERIVVLVFAVEEDSGRGVQALYAAFETPEQLSLYNASESVPAPRGLDEWAREECVAPSAPPVEVLVSAGSAEQLARSDDYISASAFSVTTQTRTDDLWLLPFLSQNELNDWTLVLRMSVIA